MNKSPKQWSEMTRREQWDASLSGHIKQAKAAKAQKMEMLSKKLDREVSRMQKELQWLRALPPICFTSDIVANSVRYMREYSEGPPRNILVGAKAAAKARELVKCLPPTTLSLRERTGHALKVNAVKKAKIGAFYIVEEINHSAFSGYRDDSGVHLVWGTLVAGQLTIVQLALSTLNEALELVATLAGYDPKSRRTIPAYHDLAPIPPEKLKEHPELANVRFHVWST